MSTSVSQVVQNAVTILNDAGMVRWTQDELVKWLGEGQVALVALKPDAYLLTITHQLVAGARQSVPSNCITLVDIPQNHNGAAVTPCARQVLSAFAPNWTTTPTASTVKHWMPDADGDAFYVYPAQNATPGKVVLTYAAVPPNATPTGNIAVRDEYADRLTDYILYRAFSKDAEVGHAERAVAYYQAFSK